MPGFDRTGPMGEGSMTGWRMGRCTNYGATIKNQEVGGNEDNAPNEKYFYPGMGRGGRGMGRGFRVWGRGRGMGRQFRFRGGF